MLLKFASFDTLSVEGFGIAPVVRKAAHKAVFNYEVRPGFLYVRSRAISSRTNDNYDTFPDEEISKAWMTFIGKPVFVNHHNDDHRRARGVIIDAALHKDTALDGSPDTWVEVLMEVDGRRFPLLAEAIRNGDIERTSMGCDVSFSVCSFCGNRASTPLEYCQHIPRLKGKRIRRVTASGAKEDVLVHEVCYGLGFFENSLLVEPPADPTAYFLGVDDRGMSMTASKTAGYSDDLPPGATEAQEHKPPLRCKVTRAFNVGIGWGRNMHNTTDSRVVVPAGTEGDVIQSWRDRDGTLKLRVRFHESHLQQSYAEHEFEKPEIVIDSRFVDLLGAEIGAPAAPSRDPRAKCPLSGEKLRGYGFSEFNVTCPECSAMVKNTRQGTYGAHKPGPGIDLPVCSGAGQASTQHGNLWGCSACDFSSKSVRSRDPVPNHKPVRKPMLGSQKTSARSDQVYVVKPINEGLDAGWLTVGGPYDSWDYDAQTTSPEYEQAERDAAANPGSEIVDGEVYDSLHPVFASRKLGYGEAKAPAQIDTLRIRECPVCGEEDSWDGDGRCRVCGYLPPPEPFRDPDLDVAQKADMRSGPVNPELFKAPAFVPPEDKTEEHPENKAVTEDKGTGDSSTDPTLQFRSARNPVHPKPYPSKVQNAEGDPMSRPTVATVQSQAQIIERQRAVIASLRQKLADAENPAQPVPEPGSDSPSQGSSNEDVRSADANTSVTTPGGVMPAPTPLAKTDPTTPGNAADESTLLTSNGKPTDTTDVTAPVGNAGTQPPLADTKTEIQPETGGEAIGPNFLGPDEWANKAASLVRMTQEHTLASLRLARLRIEAGVAQGDDLSLAQKIATELELPAVRAEIKTLAAVTANRRAGARQASRQTGPRTRSVPSLVSTAASVHSFGERPSMEVSDDEFLFE